MLIRNLILIAIVNFLLAINCQGQKTNDTLFSDFDLTALIPVRPSPQQILISGNRYIRNLHSGSKRTKRIELINVYNDSVTRKRKARIVNLPYGAVLVFDVLKTYGYEKVLIFGDKDYYYDSLLICRDTLFFKEMSDGAVSLTVVYPSGKDTLIVERGYRNTRLDFLKKIYYNPAMKNHRRWFSQDMLDNIDTYILVKKGPGYEWINTDISQEKNSEYYAKLKQEQFVTAGLSLFWMALIKLEY